MDIPSEMSEEPPTADTKGQHLIQRPESPSPSCLSVKSDWSMDVPPQVSGEPTPQRPDKSQCQAQRPGSPSPSYLSVKSDWSMDVPPGVSGEPPGPSCLSVKSDWSMDVPPGLSREPQGLKANLKSCQFLPEDQSSCAVCGKDLKDPVSITCGHWFCGECISFYWAQPGPSGDYACPQCKERFRTRPVLLGLTDPSSLSNTDFKQQIASNHRMSLKKRFEYTHEVTSEQGSPTPFHQIYTALYITRGQKKGVNSEHEVWQLESVSKTKTYSDMSIKCHEIFVPLPDQNTPIRTHMTMGIAGIGKTFCVQRFILDWANGLTNKDFDVIILFSFRELNLLGAEKYSFLRLIHTFHQSLEMVTAEMLAAWKVLFIFDGLDESRLSLDIEESEIVSDVSETASVDVLLTSLIQGSLLPSALLWITSRPAAANQIPSTCVDMVTEVRGFTDSQKREYFRKRFDNEDFASKIFSHIKKSRSLYIMCHIPVFCWMTAKVLERMMSESEQRKMPQTLTQMYAYFLLIQAKLMEQKYPGSYAENQEKLEVVLKLGRLAFEHLEKGNLLFYQEDLEDCGLDVGKASVYSGLCTEVFRKETLFYDRSVFCFVHLSIQEFLAAVYIYDCYTHKNMEVLGPFLAEELSPLANTPTLMTLLPRVLRKALKSKNGHLDLFVRFLYGLSLDSNRSLLGGILLQQESEPDTTQRVIWHLKGVDQEFLSPGGMPKFRSSRLSQMYKVSPERYINVFHCLIELKDSSIHQEALQWLSSDSVNMSLTVAHCSALAYIVQMSEEVLEAFDLPTYKTSREGRNILLQCVKNVKEARLVKSEIPPKYVCEVLVSALSSNPSHLRKLDLSDNDLGDTGEELLSAGLGSPYCQLETLRLSGCKLTLNSLQVLAKALSSNPSHLKELDVSTNDLGRAGVMLLSAELESPHCQLESLRLGQCNLTHTCCEVLAVSLPSSQLRELDLSHNDLQDSGLKCLSTALKNPHCKVEILRLSGCQVTEEGCSALASALSSNPSHLRELDLSYNHPGDSGVQLLSAGLEDPRWRLETLDVKHGGEYMITALIRTHACNLTLDPEKTHRGISLSEGDSKALWKHIEQLFVPNGPWFQAVRRVLCKEGLTGRRYWEVEWRGLVSIGATCKAIGNEDEDCELGSDDVSWALDLSNYACASRHAGNYVTISVPSHLQSHRVGVFLDTAGGTLSLYNVVSGSLFHLYTFHYTFTEPVFPGFLLHNTSGLSSVSLCQVT